VKQKSSVNETKINNNKIKNINCLYYPVNEKFMILNTYTINKNIKKE